MSLFLMMFCLFVLILLSVPVAYSLGASGLLYLLLEQPAFISTLPQRVWSGTNSFVIIAMPLFILAGELMNRGGLTKRLINFSLLTVKPIRGGLGEVNVVASMIFGGISGSSVADTSALGSVLIPQMIKKGYSKGFATGITVASSTMGMIIPPSVPMLMYAMISGASVGKLFLAGLIPGVLIGVSQLVIVYLYSAKKGYHPPREKISMDEITKTTRDGILAIIMPLIIVLSISFGVATASESAGIAVLYSLLLGFFIYKELKVKHLPGILKKTVMMSSSIMIIVGFSMIFTWILAVEQIPAMVANFMLNLDVHRFWILIFVDILILFIGTFVDVTPALLLLCPILIPVMGYFGIGDLQFGAIMITGCAVGLVTPPVGMCLNAATKICGLPITQIFKSALPFIVCNLIVLLLVTFVPEISTWLPSQFM
ncbi:MULTISPECIES: TRAP transporter large permease [unclassified Oceanispirochaeta]|uniref:TRAP transporter large permease n=1 Tax=unclassified Oceanispirochaeta TaxID=2635722 RepID=UPI000E0901A2|nr:MULTISPECIES: TRAP transporter large permease [unclassified Oceanispirochaeta]MBF9018874.1 TRAP transporter large permease [Oceanispirochaeta sp. M2]NPD75362.1 TRAP transporter large permease [Oceanispirochaeta sp. M1]RDG28790.1 TRAP transporter large permease [Oceanispirochaeta sp. M1]